MDKIELNIENALSALKPGAFDSLAPVAQDAFKTLVSGSGAGNDFLGWVNSPLKLLPNFSLTSRPPPKISALNARL